MPRIKLSDTKNSSAKIKRFFKVPRTKRTDDLYSKFKLSNDELIEFFRLIKQENESGRHKACENMILAQKGTFNDEVVRTYSEIINSHIMWSQMIPKLLRRASDDVSKETYFIWFKKVLALGDGTIHKLIKSGELLQFGFDVTREPYERLFMLSAFADRTHPNADLGDLGEYYEYLDEMNENELYEFYMESIAQYYNPVIHFTIWSEYPKTSAKIIEHYIGNMELDEYKFKLAWHPNSTDKIRGILHDETNDPKYLPNDVQGLFTF